MRGVRIFAAAFMASTLAVAAFAQKGPGSELGFQPGKLYDFSEVDSVNLYNGNLMLSVPLGPKYQVSSKLNYQFTLIYNGKMWDYETYSCTLNGNPFTCTNVYPNRRSNAGAGWRISFGRLLPPYDPSLQSSSDERDLWIYEGPTGDEHPFVGGDVSIAADASAMRLIKVDDDNRYVEMPNGEKHSFQRSGNDWRIVRMEDRFGNWVKFEHIPDPNDTRRVAAIKVTDSIGRSHLLTFYNYSDMNDSVDRGQQVNFLYLQGANGVQATYEFRYNIASVQLLGDTGGARARVPLLSAVFQPDLSAFSFDYYTDPVPSENVRQGALSVAHLPTGGSIEYHYQAFTMVTKLMCPGVVVPIDYAGIRSRIISDGDPTTKRVWDYIQGVGPVVPHDPPPGDLCGTGMPGIVPVGPFTWSRTTVLEPHELGPSGTYVRTRHDHYFDAYSRAFPTYGGFNCTNPAPDGFCPGFLYPGALGMPSPSVAKKAPYSGFGFTQPPDVSGTDSTGRKITTQTFSECDDTGDCTNGVLRRSTNTSYELHPLSVKHTAYPFGEGEVDPAVQLKSSKTIFHDDTGCNGECAIETTQSDDNGAGVYRQTVTSSNFPGATTKTTRIEYAPWTAAAVGDKRSLWITNLFSQTSRQEGTAALRQLTCFDPANGFLKWQRVLADPSKLSKNDVLTTFEATAEGDVHFARYFGADKQQGLSEGPLPAAGTDVCSLALPGGTAWYTVENNYRTTPAPGNREYYTGGILAWSRPYGRDTNTPLGFKSADRTLDPFTGVVLSTRDTAGFTTTYDFDSLPMRLIGVTPAGGAKTSYDYANATPYKNAYVTETTSGTEGGRSVYEYDGLGRLKRTSKLMPNGKYAVVQTDYDGLGREARASQPVQLDAPPFGSVGDYWTESKYDAFGRKIQIKAPDGSITTFSYPGVRQKIRQQSVASGPNSDSTATTTETYDDQGRLVSIVEEAGDTKFGKPHGDDVTTTYTYDVSGNLASVNMKSGSDSQPRSFTYDGRGFLTQEKHPENGQTDYKLLDARGHAWQRVIGGKTLDFTFDSAERLTNISGAGGAIKEFFFGSTPGSNNGKLLKAVRHNNDRPVTGNINVTETYSYGSPSGQMSQRTTLVERVTKNPDGTETRTPIQQFNYGVDYDSILQPKNITMPTCSYYGCNVDQGLTQVTNSRSAGSLTSIDGFADLTYAPSGMVESVRHKTPNSPTDIYSSRFGLPRPSKITFAGCTNTQPFFLPGIVRAKVNPNACGIQITWPAATLCGGASTIKYHVLRDNVDITGSNCLTATSYTDTTAVAGNTYTYAIVAEGPKVDGGSGTCQGGQQTEISGKPFEFKSCDSNTILTVNAVRASIGVPTRFQATLASANGGIPDETLTFSVLGNVIGTARTGTDGVAIVERTLDIEPKTYAGGISVSYSGGLFPPKTATADLIALCDSYSYGVKPLSYNVLAAGGTFPVLVLTSSQCSWLPVLLSGTFVTVNPQSTQKGTGTFNIVVPSADSSVNRSTSVVVDGHSVAVQQSANCTFRFSPALAYVPANSSLPTSINVTAPPGCAWSVTSDQTWLRLSRSSGSGNDYITFTADLNSGPARVATLSLNNGAARASVNQYAPPPVVCPHLVTDLDHGGTVVNGQNISMRFVVDGTYLEYDWYANGQLLSKCTVGDACQAKVVGPGNSGYPAPGSSTTFQAVAWNSCDTVVSSEVTFTNGGGSCKVPIITDSLFRDYTPGDAQSPFPGSEVRLYVVGINWVPGDLTYQWYHGFAGDRSQKLSDLEGGRTDTAIVHPYGTSYYWVEVSNDCGAQISRTGAVVITKPPRIRRRAVSKDFNLDGYADIPWHNTVTGQNEIWTMAGITQAGTLSLPSSTSQLQSIGDINGDERPDVLMRDPQSGKNEVWTLSFGTVTGTAPIETRADTRWSIGAGADLDNDYNDDIVWHNNVTGENEIWFLQGASHTGTWALPPNDGSGWGLHGADDFNGDSKPDLFFHNRATGESSIWLMDDAKKGFEAGTNATGSRSARKFMNVKIQPLAAMPSTDWMPALVADMNGDGHPDIVWRNTVTGENSVWIMYGTTVQQTTQLPPRADLNWQIAGGGSTVATPGGGTDPRTATAIALSAAPAPLGTAAAVTATLNAGTTPLAQRELVFLLNGNELSRLLTDDQGSATAAISVTGIAPGTYANAITVRFDGDNAYAASSAKADLVVLGATADVTWSNPDAIVYGTPLSSSQLDATANVPGTFVYTPPAGTVLNAGYQTLSVVFTPSDPSIAAVTKNAVLLVNKAPWSISWNAPAAIAYGTPLSDLQLNATSAKTGEFTYDPPAGTVLPVGLGQTLNVTFQPDDANFDVAKATTTIDVTKGPQILRWPTPATMGYGDALSSTQLNATVITSGSSPAGALAYDPPAGTVLSEGVHQLNVTAAATDFYEPASASVDVVVMRTVPSITWANPAAIIYGTPLSATQLNATASVPGTFTYTPPAGTLLESGFEKLAVLFTADDSKYQTATATVVLEIKQATPVINWPAPAPIVYGTPLSAAQLNASSATPGELTYTPKAGTILDAGTRELSVDFLPFDIRNFKLVSAKVLLQVNKAPQTIGWSDPTPIVYGTPLSATQLNATVSVVGPALAGALTYTPPAGTVLQASLAQTLTVSAAETPDYSAATASVHIDVQKATPVITWATPDPIIYKTLLGPQQLDATANVPGTFDYTPAAGTLLEAGTYTLTAHFTPVDTRNYNETTQSVTLVVQRANPVLAWTRPAGIVYGTPLSSAQLDATADVAGAFAYTPAAGTILNAGAGQTLSAHFTPTDTRNYNEGDVSTTIDVAKAPQKIVWSTPAPIVYGTPLTSAQLDATVEVVGPAPAGALTYTPAAGTVLDAGAGQTLSVAVAETTNYLPNSATVTLDVKRAPLSLVADAKTKLYGDPLPTLTGVLTGVVNNDPITASYATTATQPSPTGTYPITASLIDPKHRLANYDVTITPAALRIDPAPLLIAAVPASKQYSDPLPALEAKFTGFVLGETPAVLSGTLVIQTTAERLSPPGMYPITIAGLTSTNYAITYAGATFTETQEDARVAVVSPLLVSAAPGGQTTVTVAATVRDISATDDAAGDTDAGDIRHATLTFVDRATNTPLCTAPIGLLNDSDPRVGVAMCTFTRDFGTVLPASLVVGSRVGGYYVRDAAADDVTMQIVAATSGFVTGAGTFAVAAPAGPGAPDAASTPRFELDLRNANNGAVQGRLVLNFARTVDGVPRQYELAASVLRSLAVGGTATGGVAAFVGSGTLRDVTDKSAAIVVADGAPLIVTATDGGQPAASDSIAFTLFNPTGGLWMATGWDGVRALERPLQQGAVEVHAGK